MFSDLQARFRCLAMYYQLIHWTLRGSFFYQDHLLADRLYGEVNDTIDEIAEKGIGVTHSTEHVILVPHLTKVLELLKGYPMKVSQNADFWKQAVKMEGELTDFLVKEYDILVKANKDIGVQNLLQGFVDDGSQRVYLIGQRTTEPDKLG
jgi:DNA-binding ferritin-like protein